MNGQHPQYFLTKAIQQFHYIKFYHQANHCGRYGDGFHNSVIDGHGGDIPSPLIIFTCTGLHYARLEWPKNNCVHLKASQSQLYPDTLDRSNNFDCKPDGCQHASCCGAMGWKLFASSGVADTYTFLLNTWNTLPESYQQMVYKNTPATINLQIY
jgi:hypothetical protein